ncbi:MAG: PQQ-dependent dehydrogenase, methanol/ethanol family [Desulfurellaceae bacterium]|nr:PQQ-dependent dehydrogenase, methanol/ethanol family [Desulfurellaceae bacterium]
MQYAGLQTLLRSLVAGSLLVLGVPIEAAAVGGRVETAEPLPSAAPAPSPAKQSQNGTSQISDFKPITQERLLKGTADPSAWLMYGGSYDSTRFSPLTDINRNNVKKLQAAWMFQTGVPAQFQASPVVADGIMYMTAAFNHVYAIQAETGEMLWRYDHPLPGDMRVCCGPSNRGVAISGDKVFMATLDARLVALQAQTGALVWQAEIDDYRKGYSATAAPLIVKDKVIVGIAGGEYGIRGYVDAYDVETGERKWRRHTTPDEGEPGSETWAGDSWKIGGGPTWITGSYDPEQDVIFWATGNPSPDWNGDVREGDNLYTDSVLALDPDSGAIKWHFQFTPHDIWDYDGNTDLFLIDVERGGKTVKALAQPNRNGYLYVLDRTSGEFLHGSQYVEKLNWAKGLDEQGRPIVNPEYVPTKEAGKFICPGSVGGKNGSWTAAYSPITKYMYLPVVESCWQMLKGAATFIQGIPFWGGGPGKTEADDQSSYGHLSAVDVSSGAVKWRYKDDYPLVGGTMATAGGLVFTGDQKGYALAFDDTSGELLWKFQTGSTVRGQPATYKVNGRQYVAIPSGGGGLAVSLVGENPLASKGSTLFVFALPEGEE